MYENFGATVDNRRVEFRLFFPDNTLDPRQYVNGGDPRIAEIRVIGSFQSELGGTDWDFASAPVMTRSRFEFPAGRPIGWLYSHAPGQDLADGFYQYKYFVTFENGERRIVSDPCTKWSGSEGFENAAFVIGGNRTAAVPLANPVPLEDLIIYEMMVDDFTSEYRGTRAPFDAVHDRLDYLESLGVNAIELMPITAFPGGGFNWGYEPFLFFSVENRYSHDDSTPLDKIFKLKTLINELHRRNIAVIFDGVFNHVAPQSFGAIRGFPYHWLYQEPGDSPFTGSFGETISSLQELDFGNNCTYQFIFDVCTYWLDQFQFDGIRFDFSRGFYRPDTRAFGLNRLIDDLKLHLNTAGRDKVPLILEHLTGFAAIDDTNRIGAHGNWFDEYRSFHATYVANGGNISVEDNNILRILNAAYQYAPGKSPVIYTETHDHSTIVNSAGGRSRWFKSQPCAISLLTSPGAVMLHNGQEYGEDYCLTPFGQDENAHPCGRRVQPRPLRWARFSTDLAGVALIDLFSRLIRLRKEHPALRSRNIFPDNNQNHPDGYGAFPDKDVVVFHRFGTDDAGRLERFIIVVNYSDFDQRIDVPFPANAAWVDLLNGGSVSVDGFRLRNQLINANWGRIYFTRS